MLIRQATDADLPEVIELLKGMDEEEGVTYGEALAIWHKMSKYPYYQVFVVEDNQRIIATCSLIVIDNLGHKGAKIAVAESMIVSQEYRGHGIGNKLMKLVMEKAQEKNCYKLMLSSNKKRLKAHDFYEKLGFQQHGISFMIEVGNHD